MRAFKLTYILLILAALFACRQTKNVPQGKYLLKKNKVLVEGGKVDLDDVTEIIRQKPNFKTFGMKLRLLSFNMIDSSHVAEKRYRRNIQLRQTNADRIARQTRINKRRMEKARDKGKSLYTERILTLKDTVNPKLFFREWLKYKIGEKPVVFDSLLYNKSIEQLNAYLRKKGYYYGSVKGETSFKKNRKVNVTYSIYTGPLYTIDSVYVIGSNQTVIDNYLKFNKKNPDHQLQNAPFDSDMLDDYRSLVAKYMRDNALYGFSSSHINFVADTNNMDMTVTLGIRFSDRMVRSEFDRDSLVPVKHKTTLVKNVFFHISDTTYFKGNFKKTMEDMGLTLLDQQFLRTIDTFQYAQIKKPNSEELDTKRIATFMYNGRLGIDPGLIEAQNYLEKENFYKEYYLERTYARLLQLGLFQVIKPEIIEIPGTNYVEVHYYLVPSQKQTFGFEPRATTSNGYLGVSSSINYVNKNLFGGAEKMTASLTGGFESQPPVFDESEDGEKIKKAGRSFNTFEIGPSVKFDLPGLFPTRVTLLSKRQRPRTVISTAYNYQLRSIFERHVFQFNYLYRFYVSKTQIFQAGLPFVSTIKFVRIKNSPDFQNKLDILNDPFLRNAYSNQFIWQDWKITFEYNNKDKDDKKGQASLYVNSSFDPAGNTLSLFKKFQDTISNGQHAIFGVGYSQFARLDNEIIFSHPTGRKKSVHMRLQLGAGIPYGNTKTSMPFDYSFFAGGANDNRGWRARALGPGSYKYYLDTNRTATQIGDIRIGGSAEFRFSLGQMIKGAIFVDAGNIWTVNEDINRVGGQFSNNWYREIALSTGLGLRLDLDFFIVRLDIGLPLTNPALPTGEKWIFAKERPQMESEAIATFGTDYKTNPAYRFPSSFFTPSFHFGIGYPF